MKNLFLSLAALLLTVPAFAQNLPNIRSDKPINGIRINADNEGENRTQPRDVLLILVLDQSGSMKDKVNGSRKIDELNKATQVAMEELSSDLVLSKNLKLAMIGFESNSKILRQPGYVRAGEYAPSLTADGGTNMTDALGKAQRLAEQYQASNKNLKPVIVLITDGKPNKKRDALLAGSKVNQMGHIFALGVSGADMPFLNNLAQGQAASLKGTSFRAFFQDMRSALGSYMSQAMSNAQGQQSLIQNFNFTIPNNSGWKAP